MRTTAERRGSVCRSSAAARRNDARVFRQELAKAFGEKASGEGAVAATLWLFESERDPSNLTAAARALPGLKGERIDKAIAAMLDPLHPMVAVATAVIAEAGRRKLSASGPKILALCRHHRTPVRESAVKAAKSLGLKPIPAYDPEKAFTARLEQQLKQISSMVLHPIPAKSTWVELEWKVGAGDQAHQVRAQGWLLEQKDGHYRLLDWFGREWRAPVKGTKKTERTLADVAKHFKAMRDNEEDRGASLSRRGGLTAQFEPRFLSLPELLVGSWAFVRDDRKSSAAILFGPIDVTRDDRWIVEIARGLLGHVYHQEMLEAFCSRRDYKRALAIARKLSEKPFDGYSYQPRARNLAKQLAGRGEDFTTLTLPTPKQWKLLKSKLSRKEQVAYLAERMRLLNCVQMGQPGGVSYHDKQFNRPAD